MEVKDFVTGRQSLVALAEPANRQGRIAADVIAGRDSRFRGTQGTAIIGLFGATAASTSSRATGRFMSSVVPASVLTMQRACCCRKNSTPGMSREGCCHECMHRSSWAKQPNQKPQRQW